MLIQGDVLKIAEKFVKTTVSETRIYASSSSCAWKFVSNLRQKTPLEFFF